MCVGQQEQRLGRAAGLAGAALLLGAMLWAVWLRCIVGIEAQAARRTAALPAPLCDLPSSPCCSHCTLTSSPPTPLPAPARPPPPQLRLNAEQVEQKQEREAAVKDVEEQLALEDDESKKGVLAAELAARQQELDTLVQEFERVAVEAAKSGEGPRVSQLRRQAGMEGGAGPAAAGAGHNGGSGGGRGGGGSCGYQAGGGQYGGGGGGGGGDGSRGFPNYMDRAPAGGQQPRQQRTGLAEGYVSQAGGEGGYGGG